MTSLHFSILRLFWQGFLGAEWRVPWLPSSESNLGFLHHQPALAWHQLGEKTLFHEKPSLFFCESPDEMLSLKYQFINMSENGEEIILFRLWWFYQDPPGLHLPKEQWKVSSHPKNIGEAYCFYPQKFTVINRPLNWQTSIAASTYNALN